MLSCCTIQCVCGSVLSFWVCLFVGLSVCGSVCLWVCLSVGLSVCGSVGLWLWICLSVGLFSVGNVSFRGPQVRAPRVLQLSPNVSNRFIRGVHEAIFEGRTKS